MKTKSIRFLSLAIAAALAFTGTSVLSAQASPTAGDAFSGTAITSGTVAVADAAAVVTGQAAARKVNMAVTEKYTITVRTKKAKITSSDKKVVSVKKKKVGKKKYTYTIKAKKAGEATIRYTNKNGKTVKKTIVAKKPQLNYSSTDINVENSVTLKLNAAKGTVKWSSSDTSVATIKKLSKKKVQITGVGEGTAVITAKVGSKKICCEVNVYGKYIILAEVYSDENIKVSYCGCCDDGVCFSVTNKTNQKIRVAVSTLALNNMSYDIIGSSCYAWTTIPANSTVKKKQAMPEDSFSKCAETMDGCIRYKIGSSDTETRCLFTNIKIGIIDDIGAFSGYYFCSNDYMSLYYEIFSTKIYFLIFNGAHQELEFTLNSLMINDSSENLVSNETVIHVAPSSADSFMVEVTEELVEELESLSGQFTCSNGEDEIITVFEDESVIKD